MSYATGEVGQAFNFSGSGTAVTLGNPTALQLQNFTIEAWIQLASVSASADQDILAYGNGGYIFGIRSTGTPFLSKAGTDLLTSSYAFTDTAWHHLAVTKNSTSVVFYVDGVAYPAPAYSTSYAFSTSVAIGAKGDNLTGNFAGKIDELSIYSTALTTAQVQAIYAAASAGKCSAYPPTIATQPVSETVAVGNNASFSVTAGGTAPFSYQWQFNSANISGATASTLSLVNAQSANAGNYSVVVSSAYGSVASASASLTVLTGDCIPASSGLVSWWPGNGNAVDIADNNNGTLVGNVTFGTGEVGQAFNFSGSGNGSAVTLGNPTALQLQNFTIEAWIQLASLSATGDQVIFGYGDQGYIFGVRSTGTLFLSKTGTDIITSTYAFSDTAFHHVAVTKNGTSAVFYVDGVAYPAPAYNTSYNFNTTAAIGARGDNLTGNFAGKIDELSIYGNALTLSQIQTIYIAANAGKCSSSPPSITTQPANQTVVAGQTARFSVVASGLGTLTYQWQLGGTTLVGATSSSLVINNAQGANAGNYSVVVASSFGSVTSSIASLTVNAPVCEPTPSGLVSWWPGNGNAIDIAGGNNGTLAGNVTYVAGEVGQAFSFNGNGEGVNVGNPAALQLQNFTIDAWIQRSSATQASTSAGGGLLFSYGTGGYGFGINDNGQLFLSQITANELGSTAYISDLAWHHVAVTKSGTAVVFYLDGVAYPAAAYSATFTFTTSAFIGMAGNGTANSFLGAIDEVDVFNRALGASEVLAIFNASELGKCALAPVIASQPANQSTIIGGAATFSVTAGGTPPLSYQWQFNNVNISGATTSALSLANVQLSQAGNYAVVVTNPEGSVTSSAATLTVNLPPSLIQVVNVTATSALITVPINLVAQGSENALGFSINFDPTLLIFTGVNLGGGASGATLFSNTNLAGSGQLGLALALPAGTTFGAGNVRGGGHQLFGGGKDQCKCGGH